MERGFSRMQVDKHIIQVRQRFGFDVRKAGSRRGKHTPPYKLPEIIFIEEKGKVVPTTSSASPATQSTSKSALALGSETDTVEQTIGSITVTDPEREGLPIISTVFSLSTAEDPGGTEEHPKEKLTGNDLQIKKEMVDEDLHPGDSGYYSRLQYVDQNWKKAESTVENTRHTTRYFANLQKCHSIGQIFENMKMAYVQYAQHVGKVLPEGWDTVDLEEPILPRGARGIGPLIEDPDYHPEPISHLNPSTMGMRKIDEYIAKFEKEVQEINKYVIQELQRNTPKQR